MSAGANQSEKGIRNGWNFRENEKEIIRGGYG